MGVLSFFVFLILGVREIMLRWKITDFFFFWRSQKLLGLYCLVHSEPLAVCGYLIYIKLNKNVFLSYIAHISSVYKVYMVDGYHCRFRAFPLLPKVILDSIILKSRR